MPMVHPFLPEGQGPPSRAVRIALGDQDFVRGIRANAWFWLDEWFLMVMIVVEAIRFPWTPLSEKQARAFQIKQTKRGRTQPKIEGCVFQAAIGLNDIRLRRMPGLESYQSIQTMPNAAHRWHLN